MSKPMLLITDNYLPHYGGSRVMYHELISRMPQGSVNVITATNPESEKFDVAANYKIDRINWKRTGRFSELYMAGSAIRKVMRLAKTNSFSSVCAGEVLPCGLSAIYLAKRLGVPSCVWCHDEPILGNKNGLEARLRKWIYMKADIIIAACSYSYDKLLELGISENKIMRVSPGVSKRAEASKNACEKLRGKEKRKIVLSMGRLVAHKGFDTLIEAVKLSDRDDIVVWIAGTGPDEQKLKELAAPLGNKIKFLGFVKEADISAVFSVCDLFVMVNRADENGASKEGFGIVFAEAALATRAVISGNVGGTVDSVEHGVTGLRINSDPKLLHNEICGLLDDNKKRIEMGQAGRVRAVNEFLWEHRAKEFLEVYNFLSKI